MFENVLEKSVFRRGWHNLIQFHEENIKTIFFLIFPEGYFKLSDMNIQGDPQRMRLLRRP